MKETESRRRKIKRVSCMAEELYSMVHVGDVTVNTEGGYD